ncbi:MAG: copper chaperone PCu(A)C [Anaerolineae bacterium]|nr:copper chaperone PCu(A)C [Anaerolineae bacterium]
MHVGKTIRIASMILVVGIALAACGAPAGPSIQVQDAWARPAMAGAGMAPAGTAEGAMGQGMGAAGTGAVFMQLANEGQEADRLVGGRTEIAQVVEIHETRMEGDVMKMQMLSEGLEIPARGSVRLEPGGYHVMLIGLKQDLAPGDRFELELQFEKSGTMAVEAEVRQP